MQGKTSLWRCPVGQRAPYSTPCRLLMAGLFRASYGPDTSRSFRLLLDDTNPRRINPRSVDERLSVWCPLLILLAVVVVLRRHPFFGWYKRTLGDCLLHANLFHPGRPNDDDEEDWGRQVLALVVPEGGFFDFTPSYHRTNPAF
jgi:hypothetical protein